MHPKVPQKTTTFERRAKWALKSDSLSLERSERIFPHLPPYWCTQKCHIKPPLFIGKHKEPWKLTPSLEKWLSFSWLNVMFLIWWCSLCASEWGLTNGCGHSSIYCIQQWIWKIKMICVYSDNFLNLTLDLDLLLAAGSHPFKDKISLLIIILLVNRKVNKSCWEWLYILSTIKCE